MNNEKRLIDAYALKQRFKDQAESDVESFGVYIPECFPADDANKIVDLMPEVDAVEMDVLKAWLYEIAVNNVGDPLCDACEEIISRLDGLRFFAKEKRNRG